MRKYLSNSQGQCPYCNSNDLDYGAMEPEDDGLVYYPWKCNCCGGEGEEWYELNFIGHNDDAGNIVDIEKGED